MKHGLLLINLGTPDKATTASVRRYLREFLSDRRVINLPAPLRYLLLYCIILPFRSHRSAHAYQAIWQKEGSPLSIHSKNLSAKLQKKLKPHYKVALGMRYGNPSIEKALIELQHCETITILPLYPQYSSAATGSSIEKTLGLLSTKELIPSLHLIRDFHSHPSFINAEVEILKPLIKNHEHILFSYHGIPENHLHKIGCEKVCTASCPSTNTNDKGCYRAQCMETTNLIAKAIGLKSETYSTAFQSRFGKTPWIKPYTDKILEDLIKKGIKSLLVICPSFVADCLETIEEIGIRLKEQWIALGGKELTLAPCLNDNEIWINAIIDITGCTFNIDK